jgi:type I restriction enzyme M protein
MANERLTEDIVRKHFEKYQNEIIIEEQSSSNPRIDKLLKNASKKGTGIGRPEFIISIKSNPNLLIVVECKYEKTKHQSLEGTKYSEYAVDGVKLYARYLSKDFDVIAIAVSGIKKSFLVSNFIQTKEGDFSTAFSDELLPLEDYIQGFETSPQKFRQDYVKLVEFSKKLNDKLHLLKILEGQRSLLISCILIGLENKSFRQSYRFHDSSKELAENLVNTVVNELSKAQIGLEKVENLRVQFSFVRTDTTLSTQEKVLENLIDEIDENINSFIKTHEYFDVLGQLYIEFLRYANSDKGLGIVLTPPHITDFFARIAQVNKSTIVYDNCAGTGGFLIGAMKRMILDAKGNQEIIKNIKLSQLIGVEYQAHIFALAVSNMYIHQDGKTNIVNGSCFDENIQVMIATKKPNVGMLNPPYKSDKKNDIEELEFVINNLNCLVDGGICLAIIPMQSALSTKGRIRELKNRLLKNHTLEAVFSMPDELFFNSDVNVVSCIMVFTAKKPHPEHKETFFGYYKNDGFQKRKLKGRIDINGDWDAICKNWVSTYQNRKVVSGLSVTKMVSSADEWCAEAYIETDYPSQMSLNDFSLYVRKYAAFLLTN